MKREDIKKPHPAGLDKAIELLKKIIYKEPSDGFFDEIEKTSNLKEDKENS